MLDPEVLAPMTLKSAEHLVFVGFLFHSVDDDIAVLLLPLMSDEKLCDGLSETLELLPGEVVLCVCHALFIHAPLATGRGWPRPDPQALSRTVRERRA